MKDFYNNNVILVIYGAGALGGACAVDRLNNPQKGTVNKVLFCNQTHIYKSVSFRSKDPEVPLSIKNQPVETIQPAQLDAYLCQKNPDSVAHQQEHLEVMIAVPPQALDSAIQFFITRAEAIAQKFVTLHINALSNGAISDPVLNELTTLLHDQPHFYFCRTLVVAGFQKETLRMDNQSIHLQVTHTSGRKVYWNHLQKIPTTDALPFAGSPLFQAVQAANIRKLELQKVFANLVLGFGIQNRLLPNSALKSILKKEHSMELAKEFSELFAESGSAIELQDFLWNTVEQTHSNINSVSRSWAESDAALATYFKRFVLDRSSIRKIPSIQLLSFMKCLLLKIDV